MGIFIGFETNYNATMHTQDVPAFLDSFENIFCVLFSMELILRIGAFGSDFFLGQGWRWNLFDTLIVLMQVMDRIIRYTDFDVGSDNALFVHYLRLMRIVRITRLIRVLRLLEELRQIIASILGSMRSLGWTLVLLFMVIYMVGIC